MIPGPRPTLALLAAAAMLLTAAPLRADETPIAAIAPPGVRTAQAQVDPPVRKATPSRRDAFAPHSWAPPAVAPAKPKPPAEFVGPPLPPPAPVPQPPPLAFVYLGELEVEGEAVVYYLALGDRVYAVSPGDTIDGTYRVLAREPSGLALLYLPLNVTQFVPVQRPS